MNKNQPQPKKAWWRYLAPIQIDQPENSKKITWRWRLALIPLLLLALCGITAAILPSLQPARRRSLYLTMPDGVKIAIDVWLPTRLADGQKIPTVIRPTCYWRNYQFSGMGKILERFGLIADDLKEGQRWAKAGYALVTVDVRGTGASTGTWEIPYAPAEVADLGQVIDWVVAQPWSNGRVGAFGVSYDGALAEQMAALNHPALKAVAPQFLELDLQAELVSPGGVFNLGFVQSWNDFQRGLGANDVCALAKAAKVDCKQMKALISGVRQVDDDKDGSQLAAATADHRAIDVLALAQQAEYRRDPWGGSGLTLDDVSPYRHQAAIERSGVPMYIWASWLDSANVNGAISRYLTFSNPQKVIIGPWSHGAAHDADPFLDAKTAVKPSSKEQFNMLVEFFDAYLKDDGSGTVETGITYYTLGEGTWKTTRTWPPEGMAPRTWYFGPQGSLLSDLPGTASGSDVSGSDAYTVDWTATTGPLSRWYTSLYKDDVVYPDRAAEDRKLLTYTSTPLEQDTEITGSPVITLYVAASTTDAAFHVYLEDVAPDGRVTYITEGMLRAVNRQVADDQAPYTILGPYHTLARAEAMAMVPGETTTVSFTLNATSVLIRKGHALRIAIAGYDAAVGSRYPADATPVFTIQRNSIDASQIVLPMKAR